MTDFHELHIAHASGSYPVYIGADVLNHPGVRRIVHGKPALIVTDAHLAETPWTNELLAVLPEAGLLVLPAGEGNKTLATVEIIWSTLAKGGYGRDTLLLALGGGVVGDMTGFAASCWMRGIDFIQIPTSLLAQVDASVGGKTGVDLPAGKNLVGAFHQPRAVFIDTRTLETLPDREFRAGLAEVVKAALLADPLLFTWIQENADALLARSNPALLHAIRRSCEIKARIVETDEHERGNRAWLNLGHTFGHALEQATGYARFLHGEAVAIGLVLAVKLSEQVAGLSPELRPRLVALLHAFGLPSELPDDVAPSDLMDAMRLDKKHLAAHWRLVLLRAVGDPVIEAFSGDKAVRTLLSRAGKS